MKLKAAHTYLGFPMCYFSDDEGAPGIATRSKDATRGSRPYYERSR